MTDLASSLLLGCWLLYVTVHSPPVSGWWSENLSKLTADSPSPFRGPARPVVEINLIVPASSSPDKTRRRGQVVLSPLFLSRSTTNAILWPSKISKISEAHALGYARARQRCTPAYGWPVLDPSCHRVIAHPHDAKRLLVRAQARRHARLFGPRRQAKEDTRRLATRGTRLGGQDVLTVKMRSTTPC